MSVWATSPTLSVLTPATNIWVSRFRHLRLIAAVAVEDPGVKLAFAVSGHVCPIPDLINKSLRENNRT